jgi:cytidylate kinase
MIITISGGYGSGGQEIGVKLAELTGYAFHDRELFKLCDEAEAFDFKGDTMCYYDENQDFPQKSQGYKNAVLALTMDVLPLRQSDEYVKTSNFYPERKKMVTMHQKVINELAVKDNGNIIIMGRISNYILRDNPNSISIFTRDLMQSKISRIAEKYGIDEEQAETLIRKTDKRRTDYYEFLTQKSWGDGEDYDISIFTGLLGIDKTAELIYQIIKEKEQEQD